MNPYPYQLEGIEWLAARRNALLADEMGLGKSAQVVWAANRIGATRVLVLCPALARQVWLYEWRQNGALHLVVNAIYSSADQPLLEGVTVCSYDLASRKPVSEVLADMQWDLVVLDEAHYLKTVTSKRSQSVYRRICPNGRRVWALSGTPAPNHPGEMYPMVLNLFPESMEGFKDKSRWSFERRYCTGYNNGFQFKFTGG
jgi:SWI/SNF-related matrix-associated actin-dependent regulator 1 of chromatin subfamily A